VNVVVDIDHDHAFSLIERSGLRVYLCDILQRDTDVPMRDALESRIIERIRGDEVPIF
jgi:predicted nucleotidyltransferase